MRLIDADALPRYTGYALSADEIAKAVENAPTIDAVPVVQCKDCKHSARKQLGYGCEMNYRLATNGKFFCADGERKDDAVK